MTAVALNARLNMANLGVAALSNPTGKIYFVDSANGSNGNLGVEPRLPVATIGRALQLADAGDTIVVAPGGSETVTASLAVALAGLKIICPARDSAARYQIKGAGTLDLMTVSAANVHVEGLAFAHTGNTSSASGILTTAAADGLHVERCTFDDSAIVTTFTGFGVKIVDDTNDVDVFDCLFLDCQRGVYFSVATGKNCLRPEVRNCTFRVGQSASFGIYAQPAGTGTVLGLLISGCRFLEMTGGGAVAAAAWNGTDGTNATQGPINFNAQVTQFQIVACSYGTASTARPDQLNAISASAVGSANVDLAPVGSEFWVKKTLTSSAIVTGGVDVTEVSAGGELSLEDVICKTDASTGLAGGTNLELRTNNALGQALFFATAVSGLGAAKTIDFANASVTKIKTVLESGKKVTADATVSNCTGAGTVTIYLKFKRLTAGAAITNV